MMDNAFQDHPEHNMTRLEGYTFHFVIFHNARNNSVGSLVCEICPYREERDAMDF